MLGFTDSNLGEWPQDILCFSPTFDFVKLVFSREHKPLFIPIGLYFMKRHIWRVGYFFIKRLTKIETSLYFMKRHVWRVSYFFIKRLTKIEISSIFLNSHQKILENSRNWIFTLWNHILQTQPSLLQHILIYTYIYNIIFSISSMLFSSIFHVQ